MVPPANSDLFLFLIVLLLLVPVTAGEDNASLSVVAAPGSPDQRAPYTIQLFIPTQKMVHSDQINDLTSGPEGETIIGTSFGLSTYNGSWSTRHRDLNNISEGLMDDYVTALERDSAGNLWIGYSGGLQIYDGNSYRSIRDQQLLKETRIKDLQRWNSDMWIATGHAGIHRYRNGAWTWYQPLTRKGPGFYEVRSMALDAAHNTLVVATEVEGLWIIQQPEDNAVFREVAPRYSTWGFLESARRDPLGGVYLSNKSMVVHYSPVDGFVPALTGADLGPGNVLINDITAAPDGRLFIATDDGIYIWKEGGVTGHLTRSEGLGTTPVIRTVAIDAKNRVWFSSAGYVGFYADQAASPITIEMVTPVLTTTGTPFSTLASVPAPAPVLTVLTPVQSSFFTDDSFLKFLNPIIDPILRAIESIGSRG